MALLINRQKLQMTTLKFSTSESPRIQRHHSYIEHFFTLEKVEEISVSYNNIPENRSINSHRRPQPQYKRENKVIREVEKTEDIKIKVYWDSKSWTKVGGDMVIPDGSIQTIFFATDLDKIMRAKELIVHKDIKELSNNIKIRVLETNFLNKKNMHFKLQKY